ncbi:MAG: DUF3365 domain-containing protein [Alphaproteobacteria bacterium]|nr:DUF3365 domain-containing protein [Alphaproteobacteria bacterium]
MFRFMAPLRVGEPCMLCHAKQGYKVGDIRGGIGVIMPAASTLASFSDQVSRMLLVHAVAYIAVCCLLALLFFKTQAHIQALSDAKHAQEALVQKRTQELTEANAALGRSNAELEQFAYAVSHDLQEPLRMVASYVQLLGRRYQGKLDADADAFIGFAADGAKRMQRMITDLLDYSRVQSKGEPFLPVALGESLDLALGNLDLIIQETETKLSLPTGGMPTVLGDKSQLSRLFQNLIGNAIKYRNPNQPPKISLEISWKNPFWVIAVCDRGIGIEPQHFERIFRVFQRLHGRDKYEGSGIGLAICKKIVERHGGHIWVESQPNQGACFCFTLPALPETEKSE